MLQLEPHVEMSNTVLKMHLQRHSSFVLTHDVQDVVSDFSRSDDALLGVCLQNVQHGLQLVQSAVLTLLTDELSTYRLEKRHMHIHS